MAIYKRGKTYQYRFVLDGKRYIGSCKTEDARLASEYEAQVRLQAFRENRLGEKRRRTWKETARRWLSEHEHKRTAIEDEGMNEWWTARFKEKGVTYLDEITPDVFRLIRDAEACRISRGKRIAPATVNRKIAFLRAVMNSAAREYQWIDTAPLFKCLQGEVQRVRWIEPHEFERLVQALPEHLRDPAYFAVSTGLRFGNIAKLTWNNVSLVRKTATFPGEVMKNGQPLTIPLNQTALEAIQRNIGKHPEIVFPYGGGRLPKVQSCVWSKSLAKAGIENLRWHDLRHTWATWLRMYGEVGLDKIQELGGWRSRDMVQRYAHLSVHALSSASSTLDAVLGTKKNQPNVVSINSQRNNDW